MLPSLGNDITLRWLPIGVGLAALLRWGPWMLPAVGLGALATLLASDMPRDLGLMLAAGTVLGPALAAAVLHAVGFQRDLARRRDLVAYALIGAGAGALISATHGVLALAAFGQLAPSQLSAAWLVWWLGDAVGALVAGMPLLTLKRPGPWLSWELRRVASAGLLGGLALASGTWALTRPEGAALSPLIFVPHLMLCGLALQGGISAASLAALALAGVAAWCTARGLGPFFLRDDMQHGLALLWSYATTLSVLPMAMTVLMAERAGDRERWQLALEGTATGVGDWDLRTQRMVFSRRWKAMLGHGDDPLDGGMGDTHGEWSTRVHPEDRPALAAALEAHLGGRIDRVRLEHRLRCRDGSWKWFELHGQVVERNRRGIAQRFIAALTDVSERRAAEERLRLSAHLVQHLHEGLLITDAQCHILHANPAYTRLTGYSPEELMGTVPTLLLPPPPRSTPLRERPRDSVEAQRFELWAALDAGEVWRGEVLAQRKQGELYTQQVTVSAVRNERDEVEQYVLAVSDVTVARRHREQLERQAHYDPLTQLPNRERLAVLLREAQTAAERDGHLLAVAYLDLDHFKPLNDAYGHEVGDRVLREVAARLQRALRGGDVLARLGGDEFALLLRAASSDECRLALDRLLQVVAEPATGMPAAWQVKASIGVTVYPLDPVDADTLVRHADHAMYGAKQGGRHRVQFFDAEHDRQSTLHREATDRLRQALIDDEFVLHYQPKVEMTTGRVLGMEALLRWEHPDDGLVPPGDFLPTVERSDLAVALGEWVIDRALLQLAMWQRAGIELHVSVNVSGRHLQHPAFADHLREALVRHGPRLARWLELEVLETTALADVGLTSGVMERCRSLGVRFTLDDFGTGYSPLTYLRQLPVEALKIDRSFVHSMLDSPQDHAIVEGVITLSRTFGCSVVAEGVESAELARALVALGCQIGQGHGIAEPMPAAAVAPWTLQRVARPQPATALPEPPQALRA